MYFDGSGEREYLVHLVHLVFLILRRMRSSAMAAARRSAAARVRTSAGPRLQRATAADTNCSAQIRLVLLRSAPGAAGELR